MATESVTTPGAASDLIADPSGKMFGCLAAIESLARLLQKAHESIDEEHSGVHGTAMVIEQKAREALEMIGQG